MNLSERKNVEIRFCPILFYHTFFHSSIILSIEYENYFSESKKLFLNGFFTKKSVAFWQRLIV